jgi:hypothetical protein
MCLFIAAGDGLETKQASLKTGWPVNLTLHQQTKSCRRRSRTFTERLGVNLILVVDYRDQMQLCSELSTPETGGHVCLFHHPTICNILAIA